jgi:hypothetical protein
MNVTYIPKETENRTDRIRKTSAARRIFMWLGFSLQFWQTTFLVVTVLAMLAGGVSVVSAGLSAFIGYKVSDLVQADANMRIGEAEKRIRGREVSKEQRAQVLAAYKGKPIPDFVTYVLRDPEARMYGIAITMLLKDAGMPGRMVLLSDPPPDQTGVMFCGDGSTASGELMKVLVDAGIVGVSLNGILPAPFQRSYCPPNSIFVGLPNPTNFPGTTPPA